MDLHLTDRVYIVTGGTSGLGRAVAGALVDEGARVVVSSRSRDRVEATVAELGGADHAAGVVADVVSRSTPQELLDGADEAFGRLDGLFVSHGGPRPGPATELEDDVLDESLALAAAGPIRLLRDVGNALGASGGSSGGESGSMVALTSTSSVEPIPGLTTSNITRPAVWGYAKTLADELAPRVRVNLLVPGRFGTARLDDLHASVAEREGRTFDEVRADAAAAIPMHRVGDPAELGRVAAFLLSPAASYVTGCAWRVDGGAVRGL